MARPKGDKKPKQKHGLKQGQNNHPKVENPVIVLSEYDRLVNLCLEVIQQNKIFFIKELCTFLPFSRQTFYEKELDKSDTIKKALDDNKIKCKQSLRGKWFNSKSPALQIALYRLLGDEHELDNLSHTRVKHSGQVEQSTTVTIRAEKNLIEAIEAQADVFRKLGRSDTQSDISENNS